MGDGGALLLSERRAAAAACGSSTRRDDDVAAAAADLRSSAMDMSTRCVLAPMRSSSLCGGQATRLWKNSSRSPGASIFRGHRLVHMPAGNTAAHTSPMPSRSPSPPPGFPSTNSGTQENASHYHWNSSSGGASGGTQAQPRPFEDPGTGSWAGWALPVLCHARNPLF